jgi:hypothetical protein
LTDKTGNGNLRPPWKKGESGNPSGGSRGGGRLSFETLVERAMDKLHPDHEGITKREVLAEQFADVLLTMASDAAFSQYIRRAWPEVSRHEISADVDLRTEMHAAADEMRRLLEKKALEKQDNKA